MMVTDYQLDSDRVLALPVSGTPELVRLPAAVRGFLAGLGGHRAADVVLVVSILAGDAFRYGRPPVRLRLERLSGTGLRIEVEDCRPLRPNSRPFGYRGRLLDRLARRRGLEPSGRDGTRAWAEIG